jgi:hypothetical protein
MSDVTEMQNKNSSELQSNEFLFVPVLDYLA